MINLITGLVYFSCMGIDFAKAINGFRFRRFADTPFLVGSTLSKTLSHNDTRHAVEGFSLILCADQGQFPLMRVSMKQKANTVNCPFVFKSSTKGSTTSGDTTSIRLEFHDSASTNSSISSVSESCLISLSLSIRSIAGLERCAESCFVPILSLD